MTTTGEQVVEAHRRAGIAFRAGGCGTFRLDQGEGEPVVLVHGLPSSSFLYRKVVAELAARGRRAIAIDLPGMGLAERADPFDYTVEGLSRFLEAAIDEIGLDRFHLVVHDAGGPIGMLMACRMPERIRSLTVTNTIVDLAGTRFPGEIVARTSRRIPDWLASPWVWRRMMTISGIKDRSGISDAELDAYRLLALGDDGGSGYLRIMDGVHQEREAASGYARSMDATRVLYPVQVVWGAEDPVLRLRTFGWKALAASRLSTLEVVPGRHFLHEDQAPAIAERVDVLASTA